jgi:hypothetical protein
MGFARRANERPAIPVPKSWIATRRWTKTKLYVLNRKVVFYEPGTGLPREVVSGQYVIGILLKTIISDTEKDVEKMQRRDPDRWAFAPWIRWRNAC